MVSSVQSLAHVLLLTAHLISPVFTLEMVVAEELFSQADVLLRPPSVSCRTHHVTIFTVITIWHFVGPNALAENVTATLLVIFTRAVFLIFFVFAV